MEYDLSIRRHKDARMAPTDCETNNTFDVNNLCELITGSWFGSPVSNLVVN